MVLQYVLASAGTAFCFKIRHILFPLKLSHLTKDRPKTPYQRVMKSSQISNKKKKELKKVYLSLNPAQLKRDIEAKLDKLYQVYKKKNNSPKIQINKKLKPGSVTKYLREQEPVRLRG